MCGKELRVEEEELNEGEYGMCSAFKSYSLGKRLYGGMRGCGGIENGAGLV